MNMVLRNLREEGVSWNRILTHKAVEIQRNIPF